MLQGTSLYLFPLGRDSLEYFTQESNTITLSVQKYISGNRMKKQLEKRMEAVNGEVIAVGQRDEGCLNEGSHNEEKEEEPH
jgi:hypothetical protein